jgi:7-carboxy-7-deazaguanine synthase
MDVHSIIKKTRSFKGIRKVLITGGEPLLQKNTPLLAERLIREGYILLVETNGSLPLDGFPRQTIFIMDIKTPSSGVHAMNRISNLGCLRKHDELKFVISGKKDYLWTKSFLKRYKPQARILLSAMEGQLPLSTLAKWLLVDRLDAKLQPRLHKLINIR